MVSSIESVDINRILVRPLYFGMLVNVTAPMALLVVCYFLNQKQAVGNMVGEMAEMLLYMFGFLALAEVAFVIWWRRQLFAAPMIRSEETFEQDFSDEYNRRCRPLFVLIAATSLYGYLYYFLTGNFQVSIYFVMFSFLAFQLVRPRHGMVRKLLEQQQGLVRQGKFRTALPTGLR